jgi:SAM-dependent methyltransferase
LVRGDFARLPFDDESTDAILAVNVVYFMTRAAVGEARRVLRSGGRLVLYATHGSAMRRWPFAGRHSHRLFDRKRLTALLSEAGFARDRIRIDDVDAGFGVSGLLAVATKETASAHQPECCAEEGDEIDEDGRSRCCCAQPSSARNASKAKYLIA